MTYRVYHLTRLINTSYSRDAALNFVADHAAKTGQDYADYEILDQSDWVAS